MNVHKGKGKGILLKKPRKLEKYLVWILKPSLQRESVPRSIGEVSIASNQAAIPPGTSTEIPIPDNQTTNSPTGIDSIISRLQRDPGLRPQIWEYNVNHRDEIRRAYIAFGPYRPKISTYPLSGDLEYSPHKDAAFFLPCYLFTKPSNNAGKNVFT
ncbi:uncharacterized protein LOC113341703, partial [Papaver somniferum]|uniref:uncharacterized protein LOC113341703 n=1 Tax=Papaver somniferum TaxID=3469 RepID=UPI000E6F8307